MKVWGQTAGACVREWRRTWSQVESQVEPVQAVRLVPVHGWGVTAAEIVLASQISISVQQEPVLPLPAFAEVPFQPATLACTKTVSVLF